MTFDPCRAVADPGAPLSVLQQAMLTGSAEQRVQALLNPALALHVLGGPAHWLVAGIAHATHQTVARLGLRAPERAAVDEVRSWLAAALMYDASWADVALVMDSIEEAWGGIDCDEQGDSPWNFDSIAASGLFYNVCEYVLSDDPLLAGRSVLALADRWRALGLDLTHGAEETAEILAAIDAAALLLGHAATRPLALCPAPSP